MFEHAYFVKSQRKKDKERIFFLWNEKIYKRLM